MFKIGKQDVIVLYKKEYYGRMLYALLINGKLAFVYKSSGLSGTGHKDKIIPFSCISTLETFSQKFGYIFKEIYYQGCHREHRKDMDFDNDVKRFFEELELYLTDECKMTEDERNSQDIDTFTRYVATTAAELKMIRKDYKEDFDFSLVEF